MYGYLSTPLVSHVSYMVCMLPSCMRLSSHGTSVHLHLTKTLLYAGLTREQLCEPSSTVKRSANEHLMRIGELLDACSE